MMNLKRERETERERERERERESHSSAYLLLLVGTCYRGKYLLVCVYYLRLVFATKGRYLLREQIGRIGTCHLR